jgi:orotate phosphoribosyltransferase
MNSSTNLSTSKEVIAENLLQLTAIKLNVQKPFTWASGIKAPIYCDNRIVNSDVRVRNIVINAFVEMIKANCPSVEIIAGVATGGIPFGALIADRMELPFIYVRQEAKEHGLMKQIEGIVTPGARVVLIEDHISTGGSSMKAVKPLMDEKLDLLGLFSIMTYGFPKAGRLFQDAGVNYFSLSDLDTVVEVALAQGIINKAEKDKVLEFRDRVGA